MKQSKTVVLLDSHAILHRAYHAMGGFATRDGKPTGALYGFIMMVLRIYDEIKPDYIAACFDLPKPTFRHVSYDGYKAGRQKTDDALITQINEAYHLCEVLGIPVYKEEGFEADDLLGTLSEQLKQDKDVSVIIASGDMDTFQLIDGDRVRVYTLKKANEAMLYNEKAVVDRYGFLPSQIPDYKGLAGDSSDNIIGIKGIGEKTATDLIAKYDSLEKMYEIIHKEGKERLLADGVKERIAGLIVEGEEEALFSKTLATIRRDATSQFVFPENSWKESLDIEKYQKLCDQYEFRTLRNRLNTLVGKEDEKVEAIDEAALEELRLMNHLLRSEMTNPSFVDILSVTKASNQEEARKVLEEELVKEGVMELFETVEKPLMEILHAMHVRGITLDVKKLAAMSVELHAKVKVIEEEIYELAGTRFNVASPKQLGEVLYDKLGLGTKIKKTKTGQKSTNAGELEKIQDEHLIVKKILEHRELSKLLSTYVDLLPTFVKEDGKIHAHFVQTGAATGRFSCEDPNLQNLPVKSELGQKVRGAFVASSGKILLSCDYAQIDLRSAAILSGDKHLVEIFEKGIDVHTGTAAKVFGVIPEDVTPEMRRKAKAINFGILYGMGVTALKESMGVERKEAQEFYDQYKSTFTRLMEYLEEVKAYAWKHGHTLTLLGRKRDIPLLKSPLPFLRAQGERIAINAPIQGTSADILKLAMLDTFEYIKKNNLEDKVALLLQIHDELIFEIDKEYIDEIKPTLVHILEQVLTKRNLSQLPLVASASVGVNLELI
jgi:DNA polymerase-1